MGTWFKRYWSLILVLVLFLGALVLPDTGLSLTLDFSSEGGGDLGAESELVGAGDGENVEITSESDFLSLYDSTVKPLMDCVLYGEDSATEYSRLTMKGVINTTEEVQMAYGSQQTMQGKQELYFAVTETRIFIRIETDLTLRQSRGSSNAVKMVSTEEVYVERTAGGEEKVYYRITKFDSNFETLYGAYKNTNPDMYDGLKLIMQGDLKGKWVDMENSALEAMGETGLQSCITFFNQLDQATSFDTEFTEGETPKLTWEISTAQNCVYQYTNIGNTVISAINSSNVTNLANHMENN